MEDRLHLSRSLPVEPGLAQAGHSELPDQRPTTDTDTSAPTAEMLEAEAQLVRTLAAGGFAGPEYAVFEEDVANYGIASMKAMLRSGLIFIKCAQRRIMLPRWRMTPEDREELAVDTVGRALPIFRRKALVEGGWKPQGGASLRTYFVNFLPHQFANAYRAWHGEQEGDTIRYKDTLRGGRAPGQGRRIEDTMPHDKIRAAAARRAAATEHQGGGRIPSPGAGHALRMSGEIHDWLVGLRGSDPAAAMGVVQALAALLNEGARLGEPLVVSTAESWPWALFAALDMSYQERIERHTAVRRGEADAATLVKDIQEQAAELESAQAKLRDLHRHLLDAGSPQEAAQAADRLAAAQRQAAEVRRLLPGVIESRRRLGEEGQRLHRSVDAFRAQKEVLKASYVAAHSSLVVNEAIATAGLADGPSGLQRETRDEATSTVDARLLQDVTAQMEREAGQQAWPQGLMELRPAGPDDTGIRILFAIEPPGTALLIAVLDGAEAVQDQRLEAILLSADMLRRVRAGQAPEAAAYGYDSMRRFLDEFYPGNPGDASAGPATPHDTPEIRD